MKKFLIFAAVVVIAFVYCGKKPQIILPAPQQFAKAKALYDKGKYYKAQIEFENLIYTYPGNTVIDTAQFFLGMCYYKDEDYGLAVGELTRLLSIYPTSEFADDAQYYVAMSHYNVSPKYSLDQTETYQAIEQFNVLITNYPTSMFRSDARDKVKELEDKLALKAFKNGELYMILDDYKSALVYFLFVRDNYPSTDWAIRSFYYTGKAQFELDKMSEARETFDNFLLGYSDHELASKAKEMLKKIDEKVNSEEG